MYEQIKELLVNELNLNADEINPSSEIVADLGLNSLELADLVVMCEEKFGLVFPDEELAKLVTVGDVASYIEANA